MEGISFTPALSPCIYDEWKDLIYTSIVTALSPCIYDEWKDLIYTSIVTQH